MKFLPLFMITLLGSNASLFCMDEDDAKKAHEDSFNRHKDYGRFDGPEYAERPTEPREDSLQALLTQLKEESQQPSDGEQATVGEETDHAQREEAQADREQLRAHAHFRIVFEAHTHNADGECVMGGEPGECHAQ
jgi:hypothetical protein